MHEELIYVALLFGLFILPKLLLRFRLPAAITSFTMGAIVSVAGLLRGENPTLHLLATFGIASLFLFAGLEVRLQELRRGAKTIALFVFVNLGIVLALAFAFSLQMPIDLRAGMLLALAIITPSAGFILDSLASLGLDSEEQFWVRSKAIANELLALSLLFVTLQSTSWSNLGLSASALSLLVILLPFAFRLFASWILPFAPKSEFAFLLMIAILCAYVTKLLGAYYLVGAFLVGMAAQRFREKLPAITSEKTLHAVEVFASFFVPFYFFSAGAGIRSEAYSWESLLAGAALVAFAVPLRIVLVATLCRLMLKAEWKRGLRIGTSLAPTLVFTLVIGEILATQFAAPAWLTGGLLFYAAVNTLLPGLVLRLPPPTFEEPQIPETKLAG